MNLSINDYMPNNYISGSYSSLSGNDTEKLQLSGQEKESPALEKQKKATGQEECETCKNRKYQDGSDEMVSFKSAAHISATAAASVVRSHEQEHVSNAYAKAATGNGKVLNASVTLHTAVCPECGRTYVSGGTTQTQIKYYNEDNPYQQDLKSADRTKYSGMNVNYAV
ncbi:MAG: hypothetical protein ACI4TB_09815 [Lachnospiraceae bacterium]